MNVLKGKTALVTGATGGIGRAIVYELSEAGCNVIVTGRDHTKLARLKAEVSGVADVYAANLEDIGQLVSLCDQFRNRVDILVNCAGVFIKKPIEDNMFFEYDQTMNLNVRAPFFLTKYFGSGMVAKGWGRIVNIGSSSSYLGALDSAAYVTSKHALLGLSRATNREFRDKGVRVFCISPTSTQTEIGRQVGGDYEKFLKPEDIAKYMVFAISFDGELISDEVRLNRAIF